MIGNKILLFTNHRLPIILPCCDRGTPVEIALQNHLRSYLIHVAASVPRFLACVTQRPMRCGGGQPFIPSDDVAW